MGDTTGFDRNRAVHSDKLDWQRYLQPSPDKLFDIEECTRIDEFNEGVFNYNNAMLPRINELLNKLGGYKPHSLPQPPKYAHAARQKKRELMKTPEYRMLGAIEFLAKRGKYAKRDYELSEGPELADKIAEQEEIQRRIQAGLIDITDTAGRAHRGNCTCDLRWDGQSERCIGNGIRLRWVRGTQHHFETPDVKPETY